MPNRRIGSGAHSCQDSTWQRPPQPLHSCQGVPAQFVGAPLCASRKHGDLGLPSFWTERSEGERGRLHFPFSAKGFRKFSEVHPVRDCRRREFTGLMGTACTDGEDRFRANRPRDRFEPRQPGATCVALWGAGFESVVLSRLSAQRSAKLGQGGRSQPAVPAVLTGRQPERACSGSSG